MADTALTIGERLEEARKRKGISIREAAEATKVRGDYLLAMENSSFEINLPEIYVRGFLKIYINYLRLDVDKFMTDFDTMRASAGKASRLHAQARRDGSSAPISPSVTSSGAQSGRASFGRMEMGQNEEYERESSGPSPLPPGERPPLHDSGAWLRPVIVVGGILATIAVIVILVITLTGGDKKPSLDDATANAVSASQMENRPVTLIATGDVKVLIFRTADNARLFDGTLSAGQVQKVDASGRLDIRFTVGKNLQMERDGKRLSISTEGIGKCYVD